MLKYITSHLAQYFLMLLILGAGLATVFSEVRFALKLATVVALAGIYFLWGIWHHWEDHQELSFVVAAEYALVALLILWILLAVS